MKTRRRTWLETQALPSDLAGVLALFPNVGTHHGVCDVAGVGVLALLVVHDGDLGTPQGVGQVHCGDSGKGVENESPPAHFPSLQGLF